MGLDDGDYQFLKFPAFIALDEEGKPTKDPYVMDGKRRVLREGVVVQSEEELQALLEGSATVVEGKLRTEADERAELMVLAGQCGAKVDGRMSVATIQAKIDERQAEIQQQREAESATVL